jgi:hypothetical protein
VPADLGAPGDAAAVQLVADPVPVERGEPLALQENQRPALPVGARPQLGDEPAHRPGRRLVGERLEAVADDEECRRVV